MDKMKKKESNFATQKQLFYENRTPDPDCFKME